MTGKLNCPECGTTLAADAPAGLCPSCLVRQGLKILAETEGTTGTGETKVISHAPQFRPEAADFSTTRFGDYELLGEIAHGGMGVVFRARQVSLNRLVALKMIRSGQLATPVEVQRFRTEAAAAAKLDDPHIVPIYEIGEHDGQYYFTMQLVEGPSLAAVGQRAEGRSQRSVARLLATVARAVHYAHQRGVLHRDLKPGNILIDELGEPHLTDFGLAKIQEQESGLTQSAAVMGSANYMSPEQASGQSKQLSTATDVYGLGAILYEMLAGRPPFHAETFVATLRAVIEQEPARPSAVNPRVDRDLETICLKCLEKLPQHRYASAEALALDLERWLAGEPILARPASTWERTFKWAKRKPAVAALLGLVVLVGVAGLAGVFWQWGRATDAWWFAERKAADEARQRRSAQVAERAMRRSLYEADINLAQHALAENNLGRAMALIRKYAKPKPGEEDLRGFEWRYLWQLARGQELFTFAHSNFVDTVVFSPNGKVLATAGFEGAEGPGEIRIWDVATRKPSASLTGLHSQVRRGAMQFSPDGKFLVALTAEGLWVWETAGWRQVARLPEQNYPVFFLPEGRTMAARSPAGATFWDTTTWRPKAEREDLFPNMGRFVAASLDGKVVAATTDDDQVLHVQIWDMTAQDLLRQVPCQMERAGSCWAVSSNARYLAAGDWKGQVTLWDTQRSREMANWAAHINPVWGLSFSPDSRVLASAGFDQVIQLWDVQTQSRLGTLRGHVNEVWSVGYSPDGQFLASGGKDATVKLWPAASRSEENSLTNAVMPVVFLTRGAQLAARKIEGALMVWDIASRKEIPRSPDALIREGEGYPARRLEILTSLLTGTNAPAVTAVALSPDEELLAFGRTNGVIEVRSAGDLRVTQTLPVQSGAIRWLSFSKEHKLLASSTIESMQVWELATSSEAARFPKTVSRPAFSPDGRRLATGGPDYTVTLWDVPGKKEVAELRGHIWTVWDAAFSPDSKLLVTASKDSTARLWNAESGELIAVLNGHKEGIPSVSFSPDGKILATASTDDTVKLWSMLTGQELLTLNPFGSDVGSVVFSPDGVTLVAGCAPGRGEIKPVRLWRVPTLAQIDACEENRNPKSE